MTKKGRRNFLKAGGGLLITFPFLNSSGIREFQNDRNRILLRTGWKTESFGDLTSLPAYFRSIQRFVPNTEVILWPDSINDTLKSLLEKSFTMLNLVEGKIGSDGVPTTDELKEAFETVDLFLYAPGTESKIDWTGDDPEAIETASLRYSRKIELPYVVYGLGEIPSNQEMQTAFLDLLNGAILSFVTDSQTEDKLKDLNIKISNQVFGLNPLFAFDLKNDSGARQYLTSEGLSMQNFISIHMRNTSDTKDTAVKKIEYVLENWIQTSDHKILLIPDNKSETEFMRTIYENLSEDARKRTVVFEGDFSPDLISSILEKSRIAAAMSPYPLFSALQSDIPIFYLADWKISTDGHVFFDLGLKKYVLDIRNNSERELFKSLMDIDDSYLNALIDINKANEEMIKGLEKSFGEINRLLMKINPPQKEKKKKK